MSKLFKPIFGGGGNGHDFGKTFLSFVVVSIFLAVCFIPVIGNSDAGSSSTATLTVSNLGEGSIAYSTDDDSYTSMKEGDNNIPKGTVYIRITSPVYSSSWYQTKSYNTLNLNNVNTDLKVESSGKYSQNFKMTCQVTNASYFLKINGYIYTTDYIEYLDSNNSYIMNVDYSYIQYTSGSSLTLPVYPDSSAGKFVGWYESNSETGPWLKEVTYKSGSHTLHTKYVSSDSEDLDKIKSTQDTILTAIIASIVALVLISIVVYMIKRRSE